MQIRFYQRVLQGKWKIMQCRVQRCHAGCSQDSGVQHSPRAPLPSPPPPQLRSATGRLVGRSLENELGSLNPWSVGLGVEHWDPAPASEGGEGEAEGGPPPMW